ncbi:hypothetical protein [Streptomyces sp. NPDC048419]|uniref:hypothetical protein n=1 Tax=Streptomyces sp. NPDC048419 TaxID=3365547 RepID=UPI003719EC5A
MGNQELVDPFVENADVVVEQGELLGEEHGGQLLAGDRAWGCGQQVRTQSFDQHLGASAPGVAVAAGERLHPLRADAARLLRGGVALQEGEADVAVKRGEQVQHGRVVGLEDGPQLILEIALVPDDAFAVADDGPQLGQLR